jgi:hypothetical protein
MMIKIAHYDTPSLSNRGNQKVWITQKFRLNSRLSAKQNQVVRHYIWGGDIIIIIMFMQHTKIKDRIKINYYYIIISTN